MLALASAPFVALVACTGASIAGRDRVPAGDWGGLHVAMQVTAAGAELEFDCARATIDEPLRLEEDRFSVAGSYVREHGGPIREGEAEDRHPARFLGVLRDENLTFSVRLTDAAETIGPFTVVRGSRPRLFKCR